jgi:hypothetical protein
LEYLINKIIKKDIWATYLNQEVKEIIQEITSKKTARIQKPRTLKMIGQMGLNDKDLTLLDIGCGIGSDVFSTELESLNKNITYNGCDPFNKTKNENLKSILACAGGKSDIVTINNVLNTIPEAEVWESILNQAKDAVNENSGVVMIIVYEGEKNSIEKAKEKEIGEKIPLTPIKTRDGWQNRMKTEKYMDKISSVFPNTELIKTSAGKVILASVNEKMDLKKIIKSNKSLTYKR